MPELQRLTRRLNQRLSRAIKDFDLLSEGDHLLVCLSGGKDSYTLLNLLQELRKRAPISFELTAFHLDQKQPGYPAGIMEEYLRGCGLHYVIREEDTYAVVKEKMPEGATPCSLCSRLRRGIIYSTAAELGCNKIALGHHREDSIETLLLNLFYSGRIQAMPARYTTDDGRFEVIRPLLYAAEEDILAYAEAMAFPIIPCNLCGSIEGQRKFVRSKIEELEQTIPGIRNSILAAMGNVNTSHLLDQGLLSRLHGGQARSDTNDVEHRPRPSLGCGANELF